MRNDNWYNAHVHAHCGHLFLSVALSFLFVVIQWDYSIHLHCPCIWFIVVNIAPLLLLWRMSCLLLCRIMATLYVIFATGTWFSMWSSLVLLLFFPLKQFSVVEGTTKIFATGTWFSSTNGWSWSATIVSQKIQVMLVGVLLYYIQIPPFMCIVPGFNSCKSIICSYACPLWWSFFSITLSFLFVVIQWDKLDWFKFNIFKLKWPIMGIESYRFFYW